MEEFILLVKKKKERAERDLEILRKAKEDALENPVEFVEKLISKVYF